MKIYELLEELEDYVFIVVLLLIVFYTINLLIG